MSAHNAENDAGALTDLDDLIAEWWRTCETPTVYYDGEHIASTLLAEALLAAGYRLTAACSTCDESGLYPNPTGVFYAPTEWLGCPDCQGAGRIFPPATTEGGEQ